MTSGRSNPPGIITPDQTLYQTQTAIKSIAPTIKNAEEAKTFLFSKNWTLPGEKNTLEILARTLFSVVAGEHGKINSKLANPILAVAYLITDTLEEGIKLDIANSVTKHLLDSIIPITSDIQSRLENHLQVVNDATKAHTEITEKIQQAQEQLEVTTEKSILT
jgi:hypothetical protein